MSLSVKFNGYELNEYIDVIHGFTPLSGPNWNPTIEDNDGEVRGSEFLYTSYGKKTLPAMNFKVKNRIPAKLNEIQKILNVDEPKPLIFGNLPNRVFYAIPSGDLNLSLAWLSGIGSIVWIIPESIARSSTIKQFPAALSADGILEATVINEGTESAWLDYDIHMNNENGYLGIVSEHGIIQLGKVDETDTVPATKSAWVVNDSGYTALNGWTTNAGYVPFRTADFTKIGSWRSKTNYGQTFIDWSSIGTGTAYHGVTKQKTGLSLQDRWAIQFKPWFANSQVEGGGVQSIILANADGTYRTGIMIQKDRRWENVFKMIVFDGPITSNGAAITKFTSKYFNLAELSNKFTAWNSGMFEISKKGKQIVVKFPDGGSHTINDSDDTVTYTNVTIMSGGHGVSTPVKIMGWVYVKIRKDNVEYMKNIPNRFAGGTDIYIEGESSKVYENNKPITHVLGSNFFLVPPGETKVQFYYSDFSDPRPDVVVSLREVYL